MRPYMITISNTGAEAMLTKQLDDGTFIMDHIISNDVHLPGHIAFDKKGVPTKIDINCDPATDWRLMGADIPALTSKAHDIIEQRKIEDQTPYLDYETDDSTWSFEYELGDEITAWWNANATEEHKLDGECVFYLKMEDLMEEHGKAIIHMKPEWSANGEGTSFTILINDPRVKVLWDLDDEDEKLREVD